MISVFWETDIWVEKTAALMKRRIADSCGAGFSGRADSALLSMTRHLLFPTLALLVFTPVALADEADKQRIKELEEQMAELQRDKSKPAPERVDGTPLSNPDGTVNPKIANAVVIIEGDQGVGTGFIVSTEGKKFLYTAAPLKIVGGSGAPVNPVVIK